MKLRSIARASRPVAVPRSHARMTVTETEFTITCPYCGEDIEVYLEPDTRGVVIQDCEVCCNPWQLHVYDDGEERYVSVGRADGSE